MIAKKQSFSFPRSEGSITIESKTAMIFPINPKQPKAKSQEQSGESCSLCWETKEAMMNRKKNFSEACFSTEV